MGKIVGLVFEDEPVYTCPHCGKVYKTEKSLRKHHIKQSRPKQRKERGQYAIKSKQLYLLHCTHES